MGQVTRTRFGCIKEIFLTNAQIIALPTTPITVVPALGAGTIIWPVGCFLRSKQTVAYTNINGGAVLSVDVLAGLFLGTLTDGKTGAAVSALLGDGENDDAFMGPAGIINTSVQYGKSDLEESNTVNQPVKIAINNQGDGNLTGGNANNTLQVVFAYNVIRFTT